MKWADLNKIKKLYFSSRDLADAFSISYPSAKVTCSRYAKAGLIIRIKRNCYILRERWAVLSDDERFSIANLLEVPSYVSLTTALVYYDISTQLQHDFVESVSTRRTKSILAKGRQFTYSKIKQKYYNNFLKKNIFFIATPEKAFVDALYLMALNKYSLDISAIDVYKLNKAKVTKLIKQYPGKVKKIWSKICRS